MWINCTREWSEYLIWANLKHKTILQCWQNKTSWKIVIGRYPKIKYKFHKPIKETSALGFRCEKCDNTFEKETPLNTLIITQHTGFRNNSEDSVTEFPCLCVCLSGCLHHLVQFCKALHWPWGHMISSWPLIGPPSLPPLSNTKTFSTINDVYNPFN